MAQCVSRYFLPSPNTSTTETFSLFKSRSSRLSAKLCWHCSKRNKLDCGIPVSRENWANDISPRRFLRKAASFLSRSGGGRSTASLWHRFLFPSSLRKNVRHRRLEPFHDVLQRFERHVLIAHLNPVQSGCGDAHFLLEFGERPVAARFLEERSKLFSELLTQKGSLRLLLSHKWDNLIATASE